jgi:hypothetical protein
MKFLQHLASVSCRIGEASSSTVNEFKIKKMRVLKKISAWIDVCEQKIERVIHDRFPRIWKWWKWRKRLEETFQTK